MAPLTKIPRVILPMDSEPCPLRRPIVGCSLATDEKGKVFKLSSGKSRPALSTPSASLKSTLPQPSGPGQWERRLWPAQEAKNSVKRANTKWPIHFLLRESLAAGISANIGVPFSTQHSNVYGENPQIRCWGRGQEGGDRGRGRDRDREMTVLFCRIRS
ncbi:MAG: hypothetical protein BWX66_00223 [Deltaproteobacteria bacterium ADurb.Bin058]|nr:MAG: hypothetical protein BWX66_00223 [Deltaproteobacteria bacterium ADurb.Bin058]